LIASPLQTQSWRNIVDIARISMELDGNQPLPLVSAGQSGGSIAAFGTPAPASGPAGLKIASPDLGIGWVTGVMLAVAAPTTPPRNHNAANKTVEGVSVRTFSKPAEEKPRL
jgi:hypothetical protein